MFTPVKLFFSNGLYCSFLCTHHILNSTLHFISKLITSKCSHLKAFSMPLYFASRSTIICPYSRLKDGKKCQIHGLLQQQGVNFKTKTLQYTPFFKIPEFILIWNYFLLSWSGGLRDSSIQLSTSDSYSSFHLCIRSLLVYCTIQ